MTRLPVIAIFKETFQFIWQKRFVLFRSLIATAFILSALHTAMMYGLMTMFRAEFNTIINHDFSGVARFYTISWWIFTIYIFLNLAIFTLFATTCHRIVLLGDDSVPKIGLFSWSRQETRFFGRILSVFIIALMVFLIALVPYLIERSLILSIIKNSNRKLDIYLLISGYVTAVFASKYVVARLGVLFPATAIGKRPYTSWAFNITSGNGWRILFATGLIAIPFIIGLHSLPIKHYFLAEFLIRLGDCGIAVVWIVALSLSYRYLSAMRPDAELPSQSKLPRRRSNKSGNKSETGR